MSENLIKLISEQQAGKEGTAEYGIGEQLKAIAAESKFNAELIERDLSIDGMKLSDAAKKLQEYADKHHGKEKCFCITPAAADVILREFYGIQPSQSPEATALPKGEPNDVGFVDLADFI